MSAYRVELTVGAGHSWTIDEGDAADYGPLANLSIGWTVRQDNDYDWSGLTSGGGAAAIPNFSPHTWPAQVEPWVATFGIITETAAETADIEFGDPVLIRFYPDSAGPKLVEFGGRVRDVNSTPHERGQVLQVIAADYTLDLKAISWGPEFLSPGVPWTGWPGGPNNTAQNRWDQAAQLSDYPLGFFPAFYDPPTYPAPAGSLLGGPGYPSTLYDVIRAIMQSSLYALIQQLTPTGDLDPDHPFVGAAMTLSNLGSPLILDGTGTIVGGGVDACLIPTGSVTWRRDAADADLPGDTLPGGWSAERLTYLHPDPDVIEGWFDLPSAMSRVVGVSDIEARHNPRGVGWYGGRLAGATLRIPSGGDWFVDFDVIRTLYPSDSTGTPAAMTYADLPPALTYAGLDPSLTYADLRLIGA